MVRGTLGWYTSGSQGFLWISIRLPHCAWIEAFDLGHRRHVDEQAGVEVWLVWFGYQRARDRGVDVLVEQKE